MRDISARELKGHNILAVERFQDSTRWMVEFAVRKPRTPYGSPGDEVRLFLTEDGYRQALDAQRSQQIKIKRHAHVVEPRCRGAHHRLQAEEKAPPPVNPPLAKKGLNYVYR